MDSRAVNKMIRQIIKPFLNESGFPVSTQRTFWRHRRTDIQVVNFQSFNSYLAEQVGVTTFSYAINLGVFSRKISFESPVKEKDGVLRPEEYQCHFRGRLQRGIEQDLRDPEIWSVLPNGENLADCMADSLNQLQTRMEEWFARTDTDAQKIGCIESTGAVTGELWGWGSNPSPRRSLMLASLYFDKNEATSRRYMEEAVASGCYRHLFPTVDDGMHMLKRVHGMGQR